MVNYAPPYKKRRLDAEGNFLPCVGSSRAKISFPPVIVNPVYFPCEPSTSDAVFTDEDECDQCVLLRPEFQYAFIKSINYLDGQSFLNLLQTSREIHDFCLKTSGIAVRLPKGDVRAERRRFSFNWFDVFSYDFTFPYTEEQTKDFKNKPIYFHLSTLTIDLPEKRNEPNFLLDFCLFLDGIHVRTVNRLTLYGKVNEYSEDLIRLFKAWKLRHVIFYDYSRSGASARNLVDTTELPADIINFFLNKVKSFEYDGCKIAGGFIPGSSSPNIRLPKCDIGRNTLDRIIERWVNGDLEIQEWKLSASFTESEFYDCTDAFVSVPYEYEGPLPSTPPLAFIRKSIVYFYRRDWKLLRISFCPNCTPKGLTLRLCERDAFPNVLKYLLT